MKFVIQRVSQAEVVVEEQSVGKIDQGLMVLVSICNSDTKEIADKLINKLIHLRIFEDENGKSNLSVQDIHGNLLLFHNLHYMQIAVKVTAQVTPMQEIPIWRMNYMNTSLHNVRKNFQTFSMVFSVHI